MRVSRWPMESEDRINVQFDEYLIKKAYPATLSKDLFDHPHLNGVGFVEGRDGLPSESTKVTGKENEPVNGLIFEHKLIARQVIGFCGFWFACSIVAAVLIGLLTEPSWTLGIAVAALIIAAASFVVIVIALLWPR
jgi:hypothetical protein